MPERFATSLRRARRYLSDGDVLQAAAVMLLVNLLTLGAAWLGYLAWVVWVAVHSRTRPSRRATVLVFGKQLVSNRPGADYRRRLARAQELLQAGATDHVLLLGGCSGGDTSEAEAGCRWLRANGLSGHFRLTLEHESVDSLENLRHARQLLRGDDAQAQLPPVALLTSRYHLARCLLLARRLGFDSEPVAAEDALQPTARQLGKLLLEATYVMWIDLGVRWARLTGNRRMADRIS